MKILQINKYFYRKGGAETVFFNTINLLERQGHTVIPFCLKSKKNQSSPYSSYFVDYPELSESPWHVKAKNISRFIYNREAARQLEKLIIAEKPDIAHIHLLFNSLSVSILPVLKKYNIPVVMSVHDYRLVCPAYTFIDGQGHFCERCKDGNYSHCIVHRCSKGSLFNSIMLAADSYFRSIIISPIKLIDKFIFVSNFSRNKHILINPSFECKSTYLYNFTPPVKAQASVKGDYLFFFGRISEEKGIETLLNAVRDMPNVELVLAGTGPLLDKLKSNTPANARFVGYKSGEELESLIRGASFVIVPSETYENNPMTIIESYTIGTPVIGSNLGGIPELIKEGNTGFTFEPKSASALQATIHKALSVSDDAYNNMVDAAKTFAAQNFSEESHYQRLMEIYSTVIR